MAELPKDLNELSVSQLKEQLGKRNLNKKGKRDTLVTRLKNHIESSENKSENSDSENIFIMNPDSQVDLNKKRRREKSVKISIESLLNDLTEMCTLDNKQSEIASRLEELNQLKEKYSDLYNEILDLLPEDLVEPEIHQFTDYLKHIREVNDKAQRYISENTVVSLANGNSVNNSGSGESQSSQRHHSEMRLPKLELPSFYGDVLKFSSYWDQFRCAVHENKELSSVQKFTYLRATLKGTALKTIDGFEVTAANYDHAIQAILHRYGRKRIIVSSLVKSIIKIELKEKLNSASLRDLHDTLLNRIRALEALGFQPEDNTNVQMILIPLLQMKLPQYLAEKWELDIEDVDEKAITIDRFFKFLNKQVISKEAGERSFHEQARSSSSVQGGNYQAQGFKRRDKNKPNTDKRNRLNFSTASALMVGVKQTNDFLCAFCDKRGHETSQCAKVRDKSCEDRWNIAKEKRLCFNCLRPTNNFHNSGNCRQPSCTAEGCGKKHHRLLHSNAISESHATQPQNSETTHSGFISESNRVNTQSLLQTVTATMTSYNGQEIPVKVLLDLGSERTFIRKQIADSVGLSGPTEVLSVTTLGGNTSETKRMKRVKFGLQAKNLDSHKTAPIEVEALTINKVCHKLRPVDIDISKYPHLKDIRLADSYPRGLTEIDILVGMDFYYSIVDGKCQKGLEPDMPVAVSTKLGWILCGPIQNNINHPTTVMLSTVSVNEVTFSLKHFWELEHMGIKDDRHAKWSSEEEFAVQQFNKNLMFDGERYEVALPWRKDHPELTNNYKQALKRLQSVENQLRKSEEKASLYSQAINQYVQDGYAEEVEVINDNKEPKRVRYLPHHAVYREDKSSTKTRIVFDGSCHDGNEVSLNDCVLPGPALQPNLVSVLLRFRTRPIGLMADVQKMFLQIKLAKEDQDVHRYLWRDMKSDLAPRIFKMTRLTFGINSSPFLAIGTAQHHAKESRETFPEASEAIENDMYVDDVLTGAENESNALILQKSLDTMMKAGGFKLTKWASNSEFVCANIPEDERAPTSTIDFNQCESLKALGICWDTKEDTLFFDVANKVNAIVDPETKRSLLSIASKLFDPMGLLSPFVIRAKVIFQELWSRGLQWDEKLPDYILEKWKSWKEELLHVHKIKIPRHLVICTATDASIELHAFGDASPKAYGASVYIRVQDVTGEVKTALLMAKSRVAPVKKVSLPRLELLAALVNARLLRFVVDSLHNLKIDRVFCWTDSSITLYWIQRPNAPWKPFIANRVSEITSTWEPSLWRHCSGETNPSDATTRGVNILKLANNDLWWNGPSWLKLSAEKWPINLSLKLSKAKAETKAKAEEERKKVLQVNAVVVEDTVIDPLKYGKWSKLLRITAYVLLFVIKTCALAKINIQQSFVKESKAENVLLTAEDLINSEYFWYQRVQKEAYPVEFQRLREGESIASNSCILKLDPFFDKEHGVLRVGGRLQYSELPEETKHQVILPHGHPVVEKLIQDVHEKSIHAGPETTLTILREKIWLTQGRRDVKRVIRQCLVCQRQRAQPLNQKMAPLPLERVQMSHAFSHVGTDFCGPLYIRTKTNPVKVYICIFTCAASRMLHLELTNDMSTDEFLQAYQRMINLRGMSDTVWSDNAQSFKAASREIKRLFASSSEDAKRAWKKIDKDKVNSELATKGIKWKFIVERSPWRGGWWERFCRSVKEPLRKILGKALLIYTEMYTVLTEVEAIINARPLTFVGDDIRDQEPITPAHLAIGRSLRSLPVPTDIPEEDTGLLKRYLYRQKLVGHFWRRWQDEYLQQLSIRPKWNQEEPPLKVGDIVLVSEDKTPRGKWPLARVIGTFPGRDNVIRTVKLQTSKGQLKRPIQRCCKLELVEHGDVNPTIIAPDVVLPAGDQGGEDVPTRTRSGRTVKKLDRL